MHCAVIEDTLWSFGGAEGTNSYTNSIRSLDLSDTTHGWKTQVTLPNKCAFHVRTYDNSVFNGTWIAIIGASSETENGISFLFDTLTHELKYLNGKETCDDSPWNITTTASAMVKDSYILTFGGWDFNNG